MQSQYPVVEAVLIATRAIGFVLFRRILQLPGGLRKTRYEFEKSEEREKMF
jgi:hypothetical protein